MLEQIKLIYCHRFTDYVCFDDDLPRKPNNWYSRYQNKQQVIQLARLWIEQKDHAMQMRKAAKKRLELENNTGYWGEQKPF